MLFRAKGREKMIADRAYSPGLFASPDGRASLLYFAAGVPTVGFIYGTADLSPLDESALDGYGADLNCSESSRGGQPPVPSTGWLV